MKMDKLWDFRFFLSKILKQYFSLPGIQSTFIESNEVVVMTSKLG